MGQIAVDMVASDLEAVDHLYCGSIDEDRFGFIHALP